MDAVLNNPFRVLGLSTTASDKEIAKRISDLSLYAEMGKSVKYISDCVFLGEIDRSLNNIKEAAKKLENNDLKLFYSLMWFEIKDDVDESAFMFFEKKEYNNAKKLLEEDIFKNSPIVYNTKGRLWGGKQIDVMTWGNMTTSKIKDTPHIKHIDYEIKHEYEPPKGLQLVSLHKRFRVSTFQSVLTQIKESKSDIPVIDKYQICLVFFPIQQFSKKIALTISSSLENNIEFDIDIDFKNILTISKKNINNKDNVSIIFSYKLDIDYTRNNVLKINKIDNILEIKFNNNKLYSIDNNYSFSSFYISTLGHVFINELTLSELANRKLYCDIELNDKTFYRVKNLAIMCLLGKNLNFITKDSLDFFQLYGKLFKQPYLKKASKDIISDSYIIDELKIADLFITEFYNQFKYGIYMDDKHTELSFVCSFDYFSDKARKLAEDKLFAARVYEFEKLINDTSNQRSDKSQNKVSLVKNLYQFAKQFFKWYSEFFGWQHINYSKLQEKAGKELLECGISHYNNSLQTIDNANESILIFKQSSEFARSLELRQRIQKNSNIISELHGLEKTIFDFEKMDINNYLYSISNKDAKPLTKPIISEDKPNLEQAVKRPSDSVSEAIIKRNKIAKKTIPKSKDLSIVGFALLITVIILLCYLFAN